jgi:hypothetical protein
LGKKVAIEGGLMFMPGNQDVPPMVAAMKVLQPDQFNAWETEAGAVNFKRQGATAANGKTVQFMSKQAMSIDQLAGHFETLMQQIGYGTVTPDARKGH